MVQHIYFSSLTSAHVLTQKGNSAFANVFYHCEKLNYPSKTTQYFLEKSIFTNTTKYQFWLESNL